MPNLITGGRLIHYEQVKKKEGAESFLFPAVYCSHIKHMKGKTEALKLVTQCWSTETCRQINEKTCTHKLTNTVTHG